MNKLEIAIVDYQIGNLRSVQKALEHTGFQATITGDPEQIASARKVILPGVGAFGDAIRELQARHLVQPLVESIAAGKPFLGICLGLQMLFEFGLEGGKHAGLGVLEGCVERFPADLPSEQGLKVPHMGWNRMEVRQPNCPLMHGIADDAYFYFVHRFYVLPKDPSVVWQTCDYGLPFCASVWRDNLFAVQYHPEKSQKDGLHMLKNFAEL
jgi:glutamine amidotransferase